MADTTKTWLVTGCSTGFGELFVRQLRALRQNVIATGRNAKTRLAHLEDTGASILDLDVAAPQNLEDIFKTNFHGPLNITRALLPKLRAKGNGTLLYMSSQAGWHADATATGYCASKHALEGAIECLSLELALFAPGIKVLLIEPGYFRTRAFYNIDYAIPETSEVTEFHTAVRGGVDGQLGKEPGNPEKAVKIMIDLVRGTGAAAGKPIPLRVPLGTDGWTKIRAKCESFMKICDDWEEVAKSTDYD